MAKRLPSGPRNKIVNWSSCAWQPSGDDPTRSKADESPATFYSVNDVKGRLQTLANGAADRVVTPAIAEALRELGTAALAVIVRLETQKTEAKLRVIHGMSPMEILARLETIELPQHYRGGSHHG